MRIIGLIIAIVFAMAAFFLAYTILGDSEDEQVVLTQSVESRPVATVNVYVAKEAIDLGDPITADLIEIKQWPAHLVVDGFATVGDSEAAPDVVGQVARGVFVPGEPINKNKLSNIEDPSFIAANLPSGMRMVTISSDAVAGLAGFLFPGDRVDVVATIPFALHRDISADFSVNEAHATETLVSNVRVLAVNQSATVQSEEEDTPRSQRDRLPSSVSLEVSQEDAQRLRLAEEYGYLSLSLRSLEDKESMGEEPILVTFGDITSVETNDWLADGSSMGSDSDSESDGSVFVVKGTERVEVQISVNKEEADSE